MVISKGSVLKDVVPYAVVPVYNDDTTQSEDADGKISYVNVDPTRIPTLENLPKWAPCRMWDRRRQNWILKTPEMKKYLKKARRMASSSSDNVTASWHILCILTILHVVAENSCDERNTHNHLRENPLLSQQTSRSDSPVQWWSPLLSEQYDDEEERKIHSGDDDDDIVSILVELWPLIRSYIPWLACQRLFRRIQNRLHILKIEHSLTTWAQTTIFQLTDKEFQTSWKMFESELVKESGKICHDSYQSTDELEESETDTSSDPPNRLTASKLLLDLVVNFPERFVGVLIDDPLKIFERNTSTQKDNGEETLEISPALSLPRWHQSCLPNTCLELHVSDDVKDVSGKQIMGKICCRWIALYDLSSDESKEKHRTLSTMPKLQGCNHSAIKTSGEYVENSQINATTLAQAQRLAHSYFNKGEFSDAMSLYQKCFQYCVLSNTERMEADTNSTKLNGSKEYENHAEADLWHIMGAVLLSQKKFALAQQHWKNGSRYQSIHKELAAQIEKQVAYQYFCPQPNHEIQRCSYEKLRPLRKHSSKNSNNTSIPTVYISSDVIEAGVCDNLIKWAKEYASNNGGWTASRHYAVPTTDLPIHKVPKLLQWFSEWMPRKLLPLLQDQFGNTEYGINHERFYVHDAFLVRYEATASSHFLPLHFDESTHSCVLALNDDFEGGGSYIYSLNRSVSPSTGGMVSFLGNQCLHGGNPVTHGIRYILAIFLFLDKDLSHKTPGEANESIPFLQIKKNGEKRRDETEQKENAISKRLKKDNGSQSDGGGFSFSFF